MKHALVLVAVCGVGFAAPAIAAPAIAAPDDHADLASHRAHHPDRVVAGTLTTEVTPCDSLCTESEWAGVLDGVSSFSLISMADTGIPGENVSRFHGHLTLSTARGDLVGTDLGVWNLDSGQYVDVYTITSGSDDFAGASGLVVLWGTLDPVTGSGFSHYQGVVTWR